MGNCASFKNQNIVQPQKQNLEIIINCFTWMRDSHGLYDYENKNIQKKKINLVKGGILYRDNQEIKFQKKSKPLNQYDLESQSFKSLIQIYDKNGDKVILLANESLQEQQFLASEQDSFEDNIWIVVKSYKQIKEKKQFVIQEGDFIKMGRMRFYVKEMVHDYQQYKEKMQQQNKMNEQQHIINEQQNNICEQQIKKCEIQVVQNMQQEIQNIIDQNRKDEEMENKVVNTNEDEKISEKSVSERESEQIICRFCLFEEQESLEDPLINCCDCDGSMKYIHIKCLQKWNNDKVVIKSSNNTKSYYWKQLECEICKYNYQDTIIHNKREYDIIEIERPQNSGYLLLQILSKDKNQSRGIHILKMNDKESLKIGRGQDNDLRITDISVSRCHSVIKLLKGQFILEDNDSKFGTLVLLQNDLVLDLSVNQLQLQVGRTVFSFNITKKWSAFKSSNKTQDNISVTNSEGADNNDVQIPKKQQENHNNNNNHDIHINNNMNHNYDNNINNIMDNNIDNNVDNNIDNDINDNNSQDQILNEDILQVYGNQIQANQRQNSPQQNQIN